MQNGSPQGSRTRNRRERTETLWTGSTQPTEAQGARGEVLRGRSVTLLGVTNPGRTEPATKKARECNQHAIRLHSVSWQVPVFAPKVFFRNPKRVERYHRFPRRAVTARRRSNASSLQAFFVGFCAALKGLDNQHMHSRTPAVSGRVLHVPKRQGYARSLLNDSGSPGG